MKKNKVDKINLVLEEVKRRTVVKKEFKLEDFCFDAQLQFIMDPAKFKTAVCSRRAGKTIACAADLLHTALSHAEGDVAYITLNRKTAKKIIWKELLKLNKTYDLGGKPDLSELTLTMPHGPVIHISGAKDETEIAKFLGHPLRKCYIDEAQSFRPYIEDLIEQVLEPTMIDYDGSIILIGTPGPVPAGYFFEACHNEESWKNFKWTLHSNPHILLKSKKTPEEHIAEVCKRRGVEVGHPGIQREFFGKWEYDAEGLVYTFNPTRNIFTQLPEGEMQYIFGIDIGYVDADAIAVLGYSFKDKNVYLVQEIVTKKQDITSLANQIKQLQEKYKPIKMVMDAGALGKKIQEEIRMRHNINAETAEKHRKFEFIELLNDDLRNSRFKAYKNSNFEQDSYLVQWDRSKPGKLKISDTFHTDIGDAVLYAWRECKHFFWAPEPEVFSKNSNEYMDAIEEKLATEMENAKNRHELEPEQEDIDFIYSDD